MKTNRSPNLTAAATANVSCHSGKKPGQTSHKRKSTAETSFVPETRPTLKEVLAETPSNNSLFLYSAKPCSDDGMRIKLSRMSRQKPQKPVVKPTENTPIELIKIIGNIRVCAGCKGNLKDVRQHTNTVHSIYCVRHNEEDYFYHSQRNQWIPKLGNKHYHVSRKCLLGRNPHFKPDNLVISIDHTITNVLTRFLVERLN